MVWIWLAVNKSIRKIAAMHELYGELPDKKCADCQHLCGYRQSRIWYKCLAYGNSSSEATDWANGWTACGLYNQPIPQNQRPIIDILKSSSKKREQTKIHGQVSLFGE